MDTQENTPVSGTYEYFDARNCRSATPLGAIGIAGNGVTIFNPSAGGGLNPPPGFQWIAAGERLLLILEKIPVVDTQKQLVSIIITTHIS